MPRIQDIYYGWVVVAACFTIALCTGGAVYYGFTALIDPIGGEFGWSYAQVSLAASLRGLEMSLLAPVVGNLLDRFGTRRLIGGGVILCGGGLVLLSQTQTLPVYYTAFILITMGASTTSMTAMVTVATQWFRRRIGLANGIIISGFACGGLLIPLVTALIGSFGWRVAVLCLGGMMFLVVLPLVFLLRRPPLTGSRQADYELGRLAATVPKTSAAATVTPVALPTEASMTPHQALRSRPFWHLIITFIIAAYTMTAVVIFIIPYLTHLQIDRTTAGLIAMLVPLTSIIGRMGMGWLTDRFKPRTMLAAGIAMLGLGIICFGQVAAGGTGWLAPFLVLFAVGMGGIIAVRPGMVRHYFGRARFGSIFGLVMGATMIGGVVSPGITGWVRDVSGSYGDIWLIYGGIALLALLPLLTCPSVASGTVPSDG